MRLAPGLMAMAGLTTLALATAARAGDGDDARARKLMEDAFNRRYRWAEDFKGFSADFSCRREGRTVQGTVRADVTKPHGGVEVTCDDEGVKKLVEYDDRKHGDAQPRLSFDKAFGDCTFAIESEGARGGTKIKVLGHGFFKDFTVKEGNIIENHGGHGAMLTEVSVRQVVWMADSGKTLPREYAFRIKTGEHDQTGTTAETWRKVNGIWLPSGYHMTRTEGSAPVKSTLRLTNIKVERGK